MGVTIYHADVLAGLGQIADETVDCVVTSPPYWGLRDYGVAGQLGLEPTLSEHLAKMVEVFEQVKRVLKPTGTLWLNYGDFYASAPNGRKAKDIINDDRCFRDKPFSTIQGALKAKDLCMAPNRLAIDLQESGWWVRSEIIWTKPNPMPESVTDRPATAHEKIFLLTKSSTYFYNPEAVRVFRVSNEDANGFRGGSYINGKPGKRTSVGNNRIDKQRGHSRRHAGFNDRWDQMSKQGQQAKGTNLKNVWSIPSQPFKEAHFATFPEKLAERCINAGCPEGGTVLDPFGGAGTTAVAAHNLQRDAILIELNRDYIDLSAKRLKEHGGMFVDITIIDQPSIQGAVA